MSSLRPLSVWLCLLLALLAGVHQLSPLAPHGDRSASCHEVATHNGRTGQSDETDQAGKTGSCCVDDCHCELDGSAHACPCGERLPDEPLVPAPLVHRLVLPLLPKGSGYGLLGLVGRGVEDVPKLKSPAIAFERPSGLLPSISRQKALSVWHC